MMHSRSWLFYDRAQEDLFTVIDLYYGKHQDVGFIRMLCATLVQAQWDSDRGYIEATEWLTSKTFDAICYLCKFSVEETRDYLGGIKNVRNRECGNCIQRTVS